MANYKSLGYAIAELSRYTHLYLAEALNDLDLHGAGQTRIVSALAIKEEGISQEELARMLAIDKASVSRMIRPLLKNGMVERIPDPGDGRAYILKLSTKSRSRLPEIRHRAGRWTEILRQGLTDEDFDRLYSLLEVVQNNAREYIKGRSGEKEEKKSD